MKMTKFSFVSLKIMHQNSQNVVVEIIEVNRHMPIILGFFFIENSEQLSIALDSAQQQCLFFRQLCCES